MKPVPAACRDFCLWPYAPPQQPLAEALDGADLLLAVAALAGCAEDWRRLIADVRAELGPYATVWGVKHEAGRLGVELYFYDYGRQDRQVSLARVMVALGGWADCAARLDDALPYFMVSLELPLAAGALPARLEAVDVYIGNPGSTVSSGICYQVDASGAELKNFYFFFNRATEWEAALGKLGCGMRASLDPAAEQRLLPEWLRRCRTVVVANKRHADALYVSGIGAEDLARFLEWRDWPAGFAALVRAGAEHYRHLLFDVGYDFTLREGVVHPQKSSFYGVF